MAYGRGLVVLIAAIVLSNACYAEYAYYGCVGDGPARAAPLLVEVRRACKLISILPRAS